MGQKTVVVVVTVVTIVVITQSQSQSQSRQLSNLGKLLKVGWRIFQMTTAISTVIEYLSQYL